MPRYIWKGEDLGEFDEPDFLEITAIKKFTGMLPASEAFQAAAADGDPDCIRVMIYLLMRRKGKMVKFQEINGKASDLKLEFSEEEKAAEAKASAERVAPVTRRILERVAAEAGVPFDVDDDDTLEIIREEFQRIADEPEPGKESSVATDLPSTPKTSSTNGLPDSGDTSASTITTSNEHRGTSLSTTPAM